MSVIGPGTSKKFFTALSTDIWPTIDVPIGSELYALDIGTNYIFDFTGTWSVLYKKVLLEDISTVGIENNSSITISGGINLLDENGTPYGVKHVNNKPRVSAMPYPYDIAEGNVSGHSSFDKYAINDDIDSAAEEDIWCVGGTYSWPSTETAMLLVSSNAADASGNTGIGSVRLYYLTSGFVEKTTDVTLNGTATVTTSVSDIFRINRIRPLTVGTGLKAAGNIDAKNLANTTVYSRIAVGFTKGRQLIYTVPLNKVLYITSFAGSIGGTTAPKYGRFILRSTYDNISGSRNAWLTAYAEVGQSSGEFDKDFKFPLRFPEGSDIIVSVKTLDDNCYVTG